MPGSFFMPVEDRTGGYRLRQALARIAGDAAEWSGYLKYFVKTIDKRRDSYYHEIVNIL